MRLDQISLFIEAKDGCDILYLKIGESLKLIDRYDASDIADVLAENVSMMRDDEGYFTSFGEGIFRWKKDRQSIAFSDKNRGSRKHFEEQFGKLLEEHNISI